MSENREDSLRDLKTNILSGKERKQAALECTVVAHRNMNKTWSQKRRETKEA